MADDSYDADEAAWGESDRRYEAEQAARERDGHDWRKKQEEREAKEKEDREAASRAYKQTCLTEAAAKTDKERLAALEEQVYELQNLVRTINSRCGNLHGYNVWNDIDPRTGKKRHY